MSISTPVVGNLAISIRSGNPHTLDLATPLMGNLDSGYTCTQVNDTCIVLFIAVLGVIAMMGHNLNALSG